MKKAIFGQRILVPNNIAWLLQFPTMWPARNKIFRMRSFQRDYLGL